MDTSAQEYLKGAIEALLFISEKPVFLEQMSEVMQESVGAVDVKKLVSELQEEYEIKQRGMVIVEVAGGFQMLSSPHYVAYVRSFLKTKVKEKLSRPALETLAIVAYKQPVSRGDIEVVRGVNSDGVVLHLLNKGLIKIVGKKDVAGRPYLYGTSKLFLEYFGLKSLCDLPKLEDVSLLLANAQESAVLDAETAVTPEQSNSAASRALDAAEAQADESSPQDITQAQTAIESERFEQVAEHVQAAKRNVEDLIAHEDATAQRSESLKQAMDDIHRGEFSLDQIVAEESADAASPDAEDVSDVPPGVEPLTDEMKDF